MLILQFLVIPIVVLLMLSTVFIIASLGLEVPRYRLGDGQSTTHFDDTDATLSDDHTSPGIPFLRI